MRMANLSKNERLAVIGIAGLIAWSVYRDLFGDDSDPGINDLPEDVGPRTLTDSQLVLMADALEAALLGGWLGEDEDSIFAVMSLNNTDGDVLALVKEFGVRCEGALIQRCGSLPQWFAIYLSTDELAELNAILESKGITIRF